MAVYKNAVHRDQLFIPDKQTVSLFNIIYLNTLFSPVQNTGNPYRKIAFIVPFKRKEIVCFLLKEFPQQEKENESAEAVKKTLAGIRYHFKGTACKQHKNTQCQWHIHIKYMGL